MANATSVVSEFNPYVNDFSTYIDTFNPPETFPFDWVQMAGMRVLPPLLRSLEQQGLQVMVGHDLNSIVKLHRASGGRMKRIIQTNDPRYQPNATPADTMVLALMRGNVPQGCIAARLIWCENSLAEEMESGQFWVRDPASMWGPSDRCIVRAGIAKTIRSCHVVFSGSIYLSQEVSGGDTLAAMLRLHHIWVLCHWRWSWLLGIIEGALARRHAFDVYGATALDLGIWRTRPSEGEELHKYELTSCSRESAVESMLRPEMGDLSQPLGRPSLSMIPFAEGRQVVANL
jgi:hypothetical protein